MRKKLVYNLTLDEDTAFVESITISSQTATEGDDVSISCSGKGMYDVVTWYKGPFHKADSENFTHTEVRNYLVELRNHHFFHYTSVVSLNHKLFWFEL